MYLAASKHLNLLDRSCALLIHLLTPFFSCIIQNLHTLLYLGCLVEVGAAVDHPLSRCARRHHQQRTTFSTSDEDVRLSAVSVARVLGRV